MRDPQIREGRDRLEGGRPGSGSAPSELTTGRTAALAALGIALYFITRLWAVNHVLTNFLLDEQIYIALMAQVGAKNGRLYTDFMFTHPPGVIWAGAFVWRLFGGSIVALRVAYVLFCSLLILPAIAIARRLYGPAVALGTLFVLALTPAFCGWLGRNIYLELPLTVLIYVALWMVTKFRSHSAVLVAGILVGAGYLIKETVLPLGCCMAAALYLGGMPAASGSAAAEDSPRRNTGWLVFVLGFLAGAVAVLLALHRIPNFWRDTVQCRAADPYQFAGRLYELQNGFFQMPLQLSFGVVGAFALWRRGDREARIVGAFALLGCAAMTVLPSRLYWRHLIYLMPVCSMTVADCAIRGWSAGIVSARKSRSALAASVLFGCCVVVHIAVLVLYFAVGRAPFASCAAGVEILSRQPDPVFTYEPFYPLAAKRRLPRWEYFADSLLARETGILSEQSVIAQVRRCPSVFLDRGVAKQLTAGVNAVLRQEYRPVYCHGKPVDSDYVEVLVRRTVAEPDRRAHTNPTARKPVRG